MAALRDERGRFIKTNQVTVQTIVEPTVAVVEPVVEVPTRKPRKGNFFKGEMRIIIFKALKEKGANETNTEEIWETFRKEHPEINHWHWNRITSQFLNPETVRRRHKVEIESGIYA